VIRCRIALAFSLSVAAAACSGTSPGGLVGPDPVQSASGNDPSPSGADAGAGEDATTNPPPPPPHPVDAGKDTSGPTCPPNKKLCGTACVGLDDPAYGCGTCTPCPNVTGGTAVCENGKCGTKCASAGSHVCQSACVPENVNSCGAPCRACPSAPNASPDCKAGACTFTCAAGYLDCDKRANNGCEVDGQNDTENCGACGNRCFFNDECVFGMCQPRN
jgi:hypothetical protein